MTTHIRANGVARRPTAHDLVTLTNAGVTEQTILALQQTPPPGVVPSPLHVAPPVIVEEYHYGPAPYFRGYSRHRHHHPRHSPGGVHWGISVGH